MSIVEEYKKRLKDIPDEIEALKQEEAEIKRILKACEESFKEGLLRGRSHTSNDLPPIQYSIPQTVLDNPYKKGRQPSTSLTKGTQMFKVSEVLRKNHRALHIDEIMVGMGLDKKDRKKKVSLVGSLNQYSKKGKFFVSLGNNIFDLRKEEGK